MIPLSPIQPSQPLPEGQRAPSQAVKSYHKLIPVGGRMEVPDKFKELPLGSVVYYKSSRLPDTICAILNDPSSRKIDVNYYRVKELKFNPGELNRLTPQELQAKCEELVEKELPHRLRPYSSEQAAREAVKEGEFYAFWVKKDGETFHGQTRDTAGVIFQDSSLIHQLKFLTGLRAGALPNHPVTWDFSSVNPVYPQNLQPAQLDKFRNQDRPFLLFKQNVLEERLAILHSFHKALQTCHFASKEEAQAALSEKRDMKAQAEIPFELSYLYLKIGFYTSDDQGISQLHMVYQKAGSDRWEDMTILQEDLKFINGQAQQIAIDLGMVFGMPVEKIRALGHFEATADLPALQALDAQYNERLSKWSQI